MGILGTTWHTEAVSWVQVRRLRAQGRNILVRAGPLPTRIGRWSRHPRLTWIELVGRIRYGPRWPLGSGSGGDLEEHTQSESSLEGKILGIRSFVLIRSFIDYFIQSFTHSFKQHSKSIFIQLMYLS